MKRVERNARTLEAGRERGVSRGNLIYEKLNVKTHGLYVVFGMVAKIM